jgi:hypothetical protein
MSIGVSSEGAEREFRHVWRRRTEDEFRPLTVTFSLNQAADHVT